MNEKQFEVLFYGDVINCVRDETGKEYNLQELINILMEQQDTINKLQDKLFAMQHTIDNQENAIFHLKDTDDNLRKKNIKIEELSKVVHNLKMVLSNNDEQVAKIVGEQQAIITNLEQICEKKMQEIEDIKYSLKEIAYKYRKEVQFKADTDPNQAVKEVLDGQQAEIERLQKIIDLTQYQLKVQDRILKEVGE